MTLEKISTLIFQGESFALLPHISVDGDALGSSLALGLALKKLNKEVVVFLEEEVPYVYKFLPGQELIQTYQEQISDYRFNTVIALDSGDLSRLSHRRKIFDSGKVTVNIDHHSVNTNFAAHNYVDSESSAVGEIVFKLLELMEIELDPDIALCLYVAIATDTGGFRYSNTTALTHRITSCLVDIGIDVADVSRRVFDEVSYEKVKLMGMAINTLELLEDGQLAVATITDDALKKTGAKEEDCDGIVNIGRNIRGVEVAVLLRELSGDEIRINLRSNNYIDVSEIAKHFSGGGHKRAAGCTIKGGLKEAKSKVVGEIKKRLSKLTT